jgi:hypothetical protein
MVLVVIVALYRVHGDVLGIGNRRRVQYKHFNHEISTQGKGCWDEVGETLTASPTIVTIGSCGQLGIGDGAACSYANRNPCVSRRMRT